MGGIVSVKPWDTSGPATAAEQRFDEQLRQGKSDRRGATAAIPLEVHQDSYEPEQEIRGDYLSRRLVDSLDDPGWRPFSSRRGQQPVLVVEDAVITGVLDLRATDLPYLLEFVRCRFTDAPDLRQATLAGLVLRECRFPGLNARNLTTSNDTVLLACRSERGTVDLADARLGGSLLLNDSELTNRGGRVIYGDRLTVTGALLGMRVRAVGELRIPGAMIGGNLNLSGSSLHNRGRYAINANGVRVGGSLRCTAEPRTGEPFNLSGVLYMPSAHLAGDLRLRGSVLETGAVPDGAASQYDDPLSTLVADRVEIRGDVQLDRGLKSGGTLRMVSARIGGDLRMAGCAVDLSWARGSGAQALRYPPRALHLDGTEVLGNLDASGSRLDGQTRMVDVRVHGSVQLNGAELRNPRTEALQAGRLDVGSDLECRSADITGTAQLQGSRTGGNLDLRATSLVKPSWHYHRQVYKSSLDLRGAVIGRDLVCAAGSRPFHAEGEVQLRRARIGRQANFWGCVLGDGLARYSINAFGVNAQELALWPAEPPRGEVMLRQAQCELLGDNAELWQADGGVDVEDFVYDNFTRPVEPTDRGRVLERLSWLRAATRGNYQPGPYDQLARVFRENGNEEHAVAVLIEKQHRRYRSIAAVSRPLLRGPVLLWSLLQSVTVAYGFRPLRALIWLVLLSGAGTVWFSFHELTPINADDDPVWNPFLYTVDQLIPVVDLGHDVMWQAHGGSQWITVVLIAAGWILATTVAAGVTRSLRRDR